MTLAVPKGYSIVYGTGLKEGWIIQWSGIQLPGLFKTKAQAACVARAHMRPDENEHSQSRECWELAVFLNAAYFSVVQFKGRGQYDRKEFTDLSEAITHAQAAEPGGRGRLLYAVSRSGRQLCLDHNQWKNYLDLWRVTCRIRQTRSLKS